MRDWREQCKWVRSVSIFDISGTPAGAPFPKIALPSSRTPVRSRLWPNSTTRTCCTTSPTDTPQQFYNLLDNFSATNEHVVQQILPHPNILTCQDVGLWSCNQRTSCTTCSCSGVQPPTICTTIISTVQWQCRLSSRDYENGPVQRSYMCTGCSYFSIHV